MLAPLLLAVLAAAPAPRAVDVVDLQLASRFARLALACVHQEYPNKISHVLQADAEDRGCPLGYEPSGEDFLSPCLGEADLVRRVLEPAAFGRWLDGFLPGLPRDASSDWLAPGVVTDPSDPKLAHLDGLNLSRAWMLEGIAAGLPGADARVAGLRAAAVLHRERGLAAVTGEHYEGGHWLGTFAVYLVTGRGLRR